MAVGAADNALDHNILPFLGVAAVVAGKVAFEVLQVVYEEEINGTIEDVSVIVGERVGVKPEYVEAGIHVLLSIGSLRKAGQNLVKGARCVVKKVTKEGAGEAAGEAAKSATKAAAKEGAKATSKASAPAASATKAPAAKSAQNGAKPKPEKGKQKVTDGGDGVSASSSSSSTHVTQPKPTVKKAPVDGKHYQDHHIISDKNGVTKDHALWDLAGVKPDARMNKMLLPTKRGAEVSTTKRSIHEGRHLDQHSRDLGKKMSDVIEQAKGQNWTQKQYRDELARIISEERQLLKSGERALNKHHRPWASTEKK
ncbi:MAG: AHH domain-containing protein [Holosporales bacterium]